MSLLRKDGSKELKGCGNLWELILKADVEFFSKDAAKKRPDMLGYYDIATDTIYLNHFAVFKELKERQVNVSDVSIINRIMAVLNHETFHAAVLPSLEQHVRQYVWKNITKDKNMIKVFEKILISTIGHIWQEIGVRVYQEGQHPDQAIANVLRAGSGYRERIKENMREYEYFAKEYKKRTGSSVYLAVVEFVDGYITESIKAMLGKLQGRLDEAIKQIVGEEK